MLDQETRAVILRLKKEGQGILPIARVLKISPNTVRKVLAEGRAEVPDFARTSSVEAHRERIEALLASCEGNLVRVQEELEAEGVSMAYSTLTRFCREQGLGQKPKERSGQYHFVPGEEMQHDTSPHRVKVAGKYLLLQCASVVLCFSRMMFAQVYTTFNRFYCKVFLTEAIKSFFRGAARWCMIDNTSVVIASGTGKNAIPAPEMKSFGDRFGFEFTAHEKGDANRSARVERPFSYIEHNFYPGRTFADLADLNRQLADWCARKSRRFMDHLQARPIELYQIERPHLKPLPIYVPEVFALHSRVVNLEGNIQLHTNRYSVPDELLSRTVTVRETIDKVHVYFKHKLVAEHERKPEGERALVVNKAHRTPKRRPSKNKTPQLKEETTLRAADPALDRLVALIRKEGRGRPLRHIRKLYRFYIDYPTDALVKAVKRALEYGLTDLDRIENMTLRNIAGDYFRLDIVNPKDEEDDNE
jgi:predicted transcriptional regulator